MAPTPLPDLRARIDACMLADRHALGRRLRGLERSLRAGQDVAQGQAEVEEAIRTSADLAAARGERVPTPTYPDALPVSGRRDEIREALRDHPVVIICGETGSGKTTQLPKICLELGRGVFGTIAHTQPRRIAARSVAARIAEELDTQVGEGVGYKVRFDERTGPCGHIKLMTDGMLLAETQGDPWLAAYDTILIDEAHERSLNIDFLLGYLKELLTRRDDLKVIVTSATIDPERFSRHFGGAPIIEVSGRTYPVDIRYRPIETPKGADVDLPGAITQALQEVFEAGPGDALVFLPGERQIRETAEHLNRFLPEAEVLPLFARLSAKAQRRVFQPHEGRRVVLSTNVAETSLTVPGIRFVVDSGLARISRYSNRRKVQRLPIERISQASADQRAGRCGRVADGIAIRLYDEREFSKRDAFTAPEIQRSNLAAVILQMKALGLGDVEAFPFVEPPRPALIRDGYLTLYELGAVEDDGTLTARGRALARLPIDPRIGRMLLEAEDRGCLAETLVVAAALSTQEPRERPPEARDDADRAHLRFRHPESDFLSILKLWRAYQKQRRELGSGRLRAWCRDHHLSAMRLREWDDVHRQLRELVLESGMEPNRDPAPTTSVHRTVLAGLLVNIGNRTTKYAYRGAHDSTFWLWPGSALAEERPRWIVAAERVETTRLYGRSAAPIDPAWIEPLAEHLVERRHHDPHWVARRGHVQAFERVLLFGIEIVSKRRVDYSRIHPRQAREIFLRHALVHGRWKTRERFLAHNEALLETLRGHEARARRTGLLADADDRFAFYDTRIPADVTNGPALERWLRAERKAQPRLLFMDESDLLLDPTQVPPAERFPEHIRLGDSRFPLTYRFQPGDAKDGVTVRVPVEALGQLDADRLAWLVPGFLHEKLVHLLRGLPKARRRLMVPLPETVDRLLPHMPFGVGSLYERLSTALERIGQPRIPVRTWDPESLPPHLVLRLEVVDRDGRVLEAGRSLGALRRSLLAALDDPTAADIGSGMERSGLTTWDVDALPERVATTKGRYTVHGYPALVDEGATVSLRVVDTPERAAYLHARGVVRLLTLALPKPLRGAVRGLPEVQRMRLWYGTLPTQRTLDDVLTDRIAAHAAGPALEEIRDAAAFETAVGRVRAGLAAAAADIGATAEAILARYHDVAGKLMLEPPAPYKASVDDMISHLAVLVGEGFLVDVPWAWLQQMPRYLDALDKRLVRLGQGGLAKDQSNMRIVQKHRTRYEKRQARFAAEGLQDPALDEYRWLVEELRVHLWAQELGTAVPISAKRLDAHWGRVRS